MSDVSKTDISKSEDIAAKIVQAITLAVSLAPKAEQIVTQGRAFIAALFEAKVINIEQQDNLYAHVQQWCDDFRAGKIPPSWTVEPNPAT